MKDLFNIEFLKYIFYKFVSFVTTILGVFYIMLSQEQNIMLAVILFIVSIFFTSMTVKIKKPKFATCLDKSNFFVSFAVNLFITVSIGLIVIAIASGIEGSKINTSAFYAALIGSFVFGISLYIFSCKKNGVLN